MTTGPQEYPTQPRGEQPPRIIIADAHGREVPQAPAPEVIEIATEQLEAARTAYVEIFEAPVVDGYVRNFFRRGERPSDEIEARRDVYLDTLTEVVQGRLEEGTEDHADTTTRIVELAGNEWNAFNGALYEARAEQERRSDFTRQFGGRALIAAEVATSAAIATYTHLGPAEIVIPPIVFGSTTMLRRMRPDIAEMDKVSPATQDRGPVEQKTTTFLSALGLSDGATSGTIRREMERWLARNKPSRLQRAGNAVYETVRARLSELTDDTDIEEFRIRSGVELTFAALEQVQHDALEEARSKESRRRWWAGTLAYVALLGATTISGVGDKEEIGPDDRGPSIIEPSPTNSGPDDGVSEAPLPSDVPSEGYFDNN